MDNNKKIILIEIASYCDQELLNTIKSALTQADYPERVHFVICHQSNDIEEYKILQKIDNCKVIHLNEDEAKGSCYARNLCQQMIEDEDFIYQIDSHMRFVKHWDVKMIEQLLSLNDSKAIISFYPPSCDEEILKLPVYDPFFDNPGLGGVMHARQFHDNSPFVQTSCFLIDENHPLAHKKNAFISANNFFTFNKAHKEAFHDPELFFYGDELIMGINLYTHGWNVYNVGASYIYHYYQRKEQKLPDAGNGIPKEALKAAKMLESKKLNPEKYGFGKERTFEEYKEFAGIDFKNKILYMTAETGEFENEKYKGKISYFAEKNINSKNKKSKIEVIIVDLFEDYKECVNSCLNNATYENNISFIIGSYQDDNLSQEEKKKLHIKKFINFSKDKTYSEILSELTKYLGNNYVALTDSSFRFLNGWDANLCDNIKLCGNKSALTCWVWEADENTDIQNMGGYTNIVKEITDLDFFLPVFTFNDSINLEETEYPYQTPFISDGFLFCDSNILKNIKIDPNLNFDEQNYIYSIRLWTNGINLFYPKATHFIRIKSSTLLNSNEGHPNIVCALSGINNIFAKELEGPYEYDIGLERPLYTWYQYIGRPMIQSED